jgi:glycosyltransferase involved in cell wall biosynthesis
VAVSTGVYNDIDTWTVGLRNKLVVIFNPIMPPESYPLAHLDRSDKKQILWLGRLDEPKNPGLLLEAFALLFETSNAKLVFVGAGSLKPALEKRCSQLGLNNSVSFLGYHANPYAVIANSDLLVVSSDREGLPSVIVEAMYCGLRVVSTDCTAGINDILLGNQFGTIVPCRDIAAMARAIETELKTQHRPQDQIDGAQRFLPKVVAQQFLLAMR